MAIKLTSNSSTGSIQFMGEIMDSQLNDYIKEGYFLNDFKSAILDEMKKKYGEEIERSIKLEIVNIVEKVGTEITIAGLKELIKPTV